MTQAIDSLAEIADDYDAIVLDQWGVLHDGTTPYPGAVAALTTLHEAGKRLAVLSNSGKRAAPNVARIAAMGFDAAMFEVVMTSGEALWLDVDSGESDYKSFYPITRDPGDAQVWAEGLSVTLVDDPMHADAVLLMGLPDGGATDDHDRSLTIARAKGLPVVCTNPDRSSPRAGGVNVTSPGALAWDHLSAGGDAVFYGKPHYPIFRALQATLDVPAVRILMVGDSLEHDIEGGHRAGWATVFVRGGLYADAFAGNADIEATIARLADPIGAPMPTFTLHHLG